MLNTNRIFELLGGNRESNIAINAESMAHLAVNPTLRELVRLSMIDRLLEALRLLSDRKFEEAYAALQSFGVSEELESTLVQAKADFDNSRKVKEEAKEEERDIDGLKF